MQQFGDDLQVPVVRRPSYVHAGFHAEVGDPVSGLSHAGEQWVRSQYMIEAHTHDVWEFYLQMHGVTRWVADGTLFALHPGHLFGVAPGVVHRMADEPGGSHHFYFAGIDVDAVAGRYPDAGLPWHTVGPVVHRGDAHALAEPFAQLVRELTVELDHAAAGLTLAIDRIVLEAARMLTPTTSVPRMAMHPAVAQVRDLLEHDYTRDWSLAGLAERVGLAPTYLASLFTRDVGLPPHTYLQERRIDRAKQLLVASDLSITAIGIDVGFGSGQHFARVFRKVTGRSPREYRGRYGEGIGS